MFTYIVLQEVGDHNAMPEWKLEPGYRRVMVKVISVARNDYHKPGDIVIIDEKSEAP